MRVAFRFVVGLAAVAAAIPLAQAQNFRREGVEFNAMRPVELPTGVPPTIVVTEFFHHGELADDARNLIVVSRNDRIVPVRILQLGPGDLCRIAFQPIAGQTDYEIFYGGEVPKDAKFRPEWTTKDGLLLETRQWKDSDLGSVEALRRAFDGAAPIGADYVDNVNHSGNPFSLKVGPFLSKYEGWLNIASGGKYGFLTSSQDASFLLVDGKVVVAAPGKHGPMRHAQRGSRKDIDLKAGQYKFEYYHAATGNDAIMVAAWEVNPPDEKPLPVAIPSEVFRTKSVARVPAGVLSMRQAKVWPDFLVKIDGEVPLPDNDKPLVKMSFKDMSPRSLSMGARTLWEFGDGQTSDKPNPEHVYLEPGLYTVKLSFRRAAGKPLEVANRIYVDRPQLLIRERDVEKAELPKLDTFLPLLEGYDAKALSASALRQLVTAYQTKAEELRAQYDEKLAAAAAEAAAAEDPEAKPSPRARQPRRATAVKAPVKSVDPLLTESQQWIQRAVDAGKMAFAPDSTAKGDEDLVNLAELVVPMARNHVGNSKLAFAIWKGAADRISIGDIKAECEVEAAEIAVNDLLDAPSAKALLDSAQKRLGARRSGNSAAKLQRVWGDYYALTGDGAAARKAYLEAEEIMSSQKRFIEQTAWRGAHSRSAEDFIKTGQLDRAAGELQLWQREFPSEKLDGFLTLLSMQYWTARDMYPQAISQGEQLLAASPDSAYADQVLLLSAECELKRGEKDRALATLSSLLKNYPGSPLTTEAKELRGKIESGEVDDPRRPPRR